MNEVRRAESDVRVDRLLALCPPQPEAECVERRATAEEPQESRARHRILVQCNKLELSLQVEPIFASMALFDAREKKKVSENFYFDLNPEPIRRMLEG